MIGKEDAQKKLDTLNSLSAGPETPKWLLLDLDENTGRALVMAEDCVANMSFHEEWAPITWEECSLRTWLNTGFLDSLPEGVRAKAVRTKIENKDACCVPGGNDTEDFVFLLSTDQYNAMPEAYRVARLRGVPCWWWLRTPGYDRLNFANVNRVGGLDGGFDNHGKYVGHGYHVDSDSGCVRPAMYLDLNEG